MARTRLTAKKATGGIATRRLLSESCSASTRPTPPADPPATQPTTPPPPPPADSPTVPPATLDEQTDLIKNNVIFFFLTQVLY